MTKYTAEDFANARFAEHEEGVFAARMWPADEDPWCVSNDVAETDQGMAGAGWVPVPTKPTITESAVEEAYIAAREIDGRVAIEEALRTHGFEVTPDPEPTNTEKLAKVLRKVDRGVYNMTFDELADKLNDHNVYVKDN